MKILLLNTYLQGGAAIACFRLGQALMDAGHDVNMLTIGGEGTEDWVQGLQGFQKMLGRVYFYTERLGFWRQSVSKEVRFAYSPGNVGLDLSKHPLVQAADVIHLHWINHGLLSAKTLNKLAQLGKPIVWTMHDMWPFTGGCHYAGDCTNYLKSCGDCTTFLAKPSPNDLSNKGWKFKKQYYKNIKGVTPSRWLRDCANASSLMKGTEVVCIPNCIDVTQFKPIDKTTARKFHNLPEDKILILFLAVKISDERKGFVHLRDALLQLQQNTSLQHENIELVVVGNSKPEDMMEIPYKAHYLGHIGDPSAIIKAYNAANLFVIPSLEDNLPNTIMESLACGTPCVGFQTGGIPEMIEHQKNGYVATFKNASSFADGIAWVLENSERLATLSTNARQKALDEYAWSVVATQYVDLYKSLIVNPNKELL